jgi:uncharacterized membrane protein
MKGGKMISSEQLKDAARRQAGKAKAVVQTSAELALVMEKMDDETWVKAKDQIVENFAMMVGAFESASKNEFLAAMSLAKMMENQGE